MRFFDFVVEQDPDTSLYVGYVPGWPGAHSQAESLDEEVELAATTEVTFLLLTPLKGG